MALKNYSVFLFSANMAVGRNKDAISLLINKFIGAYNSPDSRYLERD